MECQIIKNLNLLIIKEGESKLTEKHTTTNLNYKKSVGPTFLLVGTISIVIATLYESNILALIGIALAFWGALLLYIVVKHVPIEILNAAVISPLENIERMLSNNNVVTNGIYLSPKYVHNNDHSLVFVALNGQEALPQPEEIDENSLYSQNNLGLLFIPPGFALSRLLEKNLQMLFTQLTLDQLLENLPKLLVEKTQLLEKIDVTKKENTITMTVTNNLLKETCKEMSHLPITHKTLGCPFTSAIACALAKASGKPIIITKDEQSQNGKTTEICYQILNR